jgi:DNA adenine methylase
MIPILRAWLGSQRRRILTFLEPFAGGASASLMAVSEGFCDEAIFSDLDVAVAAVWQCALSNDGDALARRVEQFRVTQKNVKELFSKAGDDAPAIERALAVLVRNRIHRGGVLADGAGVLKHGENGNGIRSRWYPKTIASRLLEIYKQRNKFSFLRRDGFSLLSQYDEDASSVAFVDPPYFGPANRLYRHWQVDHEKVFQTLDGFKGDFLLAYDDVPDIRQLASKYELSVAVVAMKTTHHRKKQELLLSRNLEWLNHRMPKSEHSKAASVQIRTFEKTLSGRFSAV